MLVQDEADRTNNKDGSSQYLVMEVGSALICFAVVVYFIDTSPRRTSQARGLTIWYRSLSLW